ncbi:TetR/AcrR family transcriptional regulator [Lentilitoribacter sp. Alg239-R112]|uniref:TetR/AcrR family transcriptional regulator n=1 Tax=Lentilitoribacter sp. Alg239-R112 TaxID=2305987 RepID=UPI0018DA0EAB|nr:TetR/AcrR family transcriptional regulator [Lentilitoribacter sp. Alg239-R112]
MTDTKKKRGRPRGFDKEKATNIALKLFWDDGYEATGLSKLTSNIGVGAPSLYAAFGSKADLFAQTVQLYQDRCAPLFEPAFQANNLEDFTELLFSAAVESYTSPDGGRGCLVLDGTRNASDPDALKITQKVRDDFRAQLVVKLSELKVQDPSKVADTYQTAMIGLSGAARHHLSKNRLQEIASMLVHSFQKI